MKRVSLWDININFDDLLMLYLTLAGSEFYMVSYQN